MKPATSPATRTASKPVTARLSTRPRTVLHLLLAVASWGALSLTVLLTALLAGWILLAVPLVGGLTPSQPIPVPMILAVLLAMTGGFAWLVSKYVASPRHVFLAIGLILSLLFIVGVTWALSAPKHALFLARDMAWDGTDVLQVQQFPVRTISNAGPAFHFQQKLSPQVFQALEYKQEGQVKQASLDELLQSSHTTSFIVVKDDAIVYEGYFNNYSRESVVPSFSIAKSVTSALIGIAIDEGHIYSVDDPIIGYLPELRGKGLDGVTIRHLLTMSTGIRYVHGDELPPLLRPLPFSDDSWTTSFPDLRSLALSVKPDAEIPGAAWKYNNYYPQLLGLILERTTHRSAWNIRRHGAWTARNADSRRWSRVSTRAPLTLPSSADSSSTRATGMESRSSRSDGSATPPRPIPATTVPGASPLTGSRRTATTSTCGGDYTGRMAATFTWRGAACNSSGSMSRLRIESSLPALVSSREAWTGGPTSSRASSRK